MQTIQNQVDSCDNSLPQSTYIRPVSDLCISSAVFFCRKMLCTICITGLSAVAARIAIWSATCPAKGVTVNQSFKHRRNIDTLKGAVNMIESSNDSSSGSLTGQRRSRSKQAETGPSICARSIQRKEKQKHTMSDMSLGTPSEDARCMLHGLRDTIQKQYPSRTMPENCVMKNVIIDGATTNLIWGSSVTTAVVITGVHLTRWFTSPSRHMVSEMLICLLAIIGVVLFLRDVHQCKIQAGMCKLLVFLLLANCVLPWLHYNPVLDDLEGEEELSPL